MAGVMAPGFPAGKGAMFPDARRSRRPRCKAGAAGVRTAGLGATDALECGAMERLVHLSRRGPGRFVRGPSDVWAMRPEDLCRAGIQGSSESVFTALQRPWRWGADKPPVSARLWGELEPWGRVLPRIEQQRTSRDGSTKLLLSVRGELIETVHMPRAIGTGRVTLCVSSQAGCALGCRFCATAGLGLRRQLSAGEIVGQVLVAMRALGPRHPGELTLVFMGMGEPLHNLAQVARAISILAHPAGLGLPLARITVSTSGLVPELGELGALPLRPLLAVSLNATTDELRSELMPINRRYPLAELRRALERYPCRPRERITIEYVLLAGINDGPPDAQRLAEFCAGFPHHINLIPFNAHERAAYRAPSEAAIDAFAKALLERRPALVTVRRSRGRDVQAACGQLASARG